MGKKIETKNKKSKDNNRSVKTGLVGLMWKAFGVLVILAVLFFTLLSTGAVGYLPDIDELENPIDRYASQVIASNNELLFTYSLSDDNRIMVDYSELSPHLIGALVSTEDIRYYTHSGIDIIGLGR